MSLSRVRLSALQMMLEKPEVQVDPPEAGRIIACFTKLSTLVTASFDPYFGRSDWRTVDEIVAPVWTHIVTYSDLSDANKNHMENINLQRTIRRLWKLTRYQTRHEGLSGSSLRARVVSLIIAFGMQVMGVVSPDDPRFDDLLSEHGEERLFRTAMTAWREVQPRDEQQETAHTAQTIARTLPVSEVSEPCASTDECNICTERMASGVKVKVCGHVFCAKCLEAWMHNGRGATGCCPMCRAVLAQEVAD